MHKDLQPRRRSVARFIHFCVFVSRRVATKIYKNHVKKDVTFLLGGSGLIWKCEMEIDGYHFEKIHVNTFLKGCSMSTIPKSSRYGLVTRTFIIKLWAKCRKIFQSHGSYGITNRQKTTHSKAAQPRRQLVLGSWILAKHMHMLFDNLTLTLCVCDFFFR